MSDKEILSVLWDIAHSDNLSEVARVIRPVLDYFGIEAESLGELQEEMRDRGLVPDDDELPAKVSCSNPV